MSVMKRMSEKNNATEKKNYEKKEFVGVCLHVSVWTRCRRCVSVPD